MSPDVLVKSQFNEKVSLMTYYILISADRRNPSDIQDCIWQSPDQLIGCFSAWRLVFPAVWCFAGDYHSEEIHCWGFRQTRPLLGPRCWSQIGRLVCFWWGDVVPCTFSLLFLRFSFSCTSSVWVIGTDRLLRHPLHRWLQNSLLQAQKGFLWEKTNESEEYKLELGVINRKEGRQHLVSRLYQLTLLSCLLLWLYLILFSF